MDANIWIDIAVRSDEYPESRKLYRSLTKQSEELFIAGSSYTDIYYILSKIKNKIFARIYLKSLLTKGVRMLAFTENDLKKADEFEISDYEDACVLATAINNRCDLIVTRNAKDLQNELIDIKTPNQILQDLIPS